MAPRSVIRCEGKQSTCYSINNRHTITVAQSIGTTSYYDREHCNISLEMMKIIFSLCSFFRIALTFTFISVVCNLSNSAQSAALNSMSNLETPSTIGFIGCGTIACAIATGLLTQNEIPVSKIYVSRRSESKSSLLAEKFGDRVSVCDDNQDIVNSCDVVFLCVLPAQEEEVLTGLDIGKENTLVSLVVRRHKRITLFKMLHVHC